MSYLTTIQEVDGRMGFRNGTGRAGDMNLGFCSCSMVAVVVYTMSEVDETALYAEVVPDGAKWVNAMEFYGSLKPLTRNVYGVCQA